MAHVPNRYWQCRVHWCMNMPRVRSVRWYKGFVSLLGHGVFIFFLLRGDNWQFLIIFVLSHLLPYTQLWVFLFLGI